MLEDFYDQYVATALWATWDDNGDPLDARFSVEDIDAEALEAMRKDCSAFYDANQALWTEDGIEDSTAGHDFWLTRNGHGAGYWDGDYPTNGDRLTEACKPYGESVLYVGDDQRIYLC